MITELGTAKIVVTGTKSPLTSEYSAIVEWEIIDDRKVRIDTIKIFTEDTLIGQFNKDFTIELDHNSDNTHIEWLHYAFDKKSVILIFNKNRNNLTNNHWE